MTRIAPNGREGNSTPAANGHAIDFDAIRRRIDFRKLVEHELGITLNRDGRCCCPFHGGDNPTAFRVGQRSAKCFACDWSGDVFDFYAALHPECDGPGGAAKVLGQLPQAKAKAKGKAAGGSSRGIAYTTFQEALEAAERLPWGQGEGRLGKAAFLYAYPAANGRVTAYVARYERRILVEGEPTRQKTFRPISLHGDGWKIADPPGKWPLYNLPTLGAAHRVLIFEGEKCCGLAQVFECAVTTSAHGAQAPARTDWTPLAGKLVVIFSDRGKAGEAYLEKVLALLASLEPRPTIKIVRLPVPEDGDDLEQWLEERDSWEPERIRAELDRLIEEAPPWQPATDAPRDSAPPAPAAGRDRASDDRAPVEYLEAEAGLFLRRTIQGEGLTTRLANFTARIVCDVVRHEAGDIRRQVRIVATHADGTTAATVVDAAQWAAMGWVEDGLGPKFTVTAGKGHRDHVRAAIQLLSVRDGFDAETVHTSLGWVEHHGRPLYLHAGGCIAHDGTCGDARVEADAALGRYALPDPPSSRHDIAGAITAVRGLLDLGQAARPAARHVAAILATLPWRAVLGPLDSSVHFSGPTGTFKTTTALLALDHFAPGSGAGRVAVTWGATPNALQRHAYDCRDSLLVIDELTGETAVETATEFFQCQGNLKARARMTRDLRIAPSLDPRGTVLSTGEADPSRRSALGRMLTVRFTRETVDVATLSRCQQDAAAGRYARAMAAYIRWLAAPGRLAATRAELRRLVDQIAGEVRADPANRDVHPRHPAAVAELVAAYALFLRFAGEAGGVPQRTADASLATVRGSLI
ncbi:MAG: DUF927 domain-containing protein, partial [Planctomycetaceae bacterium]|nr:DUF927 domain-containing protein [Planctomycetaceae bacterium]